METVSTMGSGDLGRELDLDVLIDALEHEFPIKTNRHSNSMTTIRLDEEAPAITLYRTGSYQIRGTKDRAALFEANEEFLQTIESIGLTPGCGSFSQKNAVYLIDFEQEVILEQLAVHLGLENVEYEPEQFPGVIYRPPDTGTVNLVFSSGKAIISGTISDEIAESAADHLRQEIRNLSG